MDITITDIEEGTHKWAQLMELQGKRVDYEQTTDRWVPISALQVAPDSIAAGRRWRLVKEPPVDIIAKVGTPEWALLNLYQGKMVRHPDWPNKSSFLLIVRYNIVDNLGNVQSDPFYWTKMTGWEVVD